MRHILIEGRQHKAGQASFDARRSQSAWRIVLAGGLALAIIGLLDAYAVWAAAAELGEGSMVQFAETFAESQTRAMVGLTLAVAGGLAGPRVRILAGLVPWALLLAAVALFAAGVNFVTRPDATSASHRAVLMAEGLRSLATCAFFAFLAYASLLGARHSK